MRISRIGVSCLIVSIVLVLGIATGQVERTLLDGDSVAIPFALASTQILIDDVFVNGEGPFRFLLDTGAMGGGRVDVTLVETLSLEPADEVMAGDGTNRPDRRMPAYVLGTLEVGGLRCEGVSVLSRDYNRPGKEVRGHIDGVLGFALFEEYLLTVDYASRTIRVERGELPEPDGVEILAMAGDGGPGVEVELGGRRHVARLDTGSMGAISVSEEIADSLTFQAEPEVIGEARTMTGAFSIRRARADGEFRIGRHVRTSPEVVVGGPLLGMNVGGDLLREFVVTYDQRGQRVRFRAAESTRPEGAPKRSRLGQGPVPVPMDLVGGRPAIEATVNGNGPFLFIVDTGAGGMILDANLAEELELTPTGRTRIGDPARPDAIEASTFELERVAIGGTTFEGLAALAIDNRILGDARGIIGLPVLQDAIVTIDFPEERLVLSRGALSPHDGSVAYGLDGDFLITIPLDVAGQAIDAHVDSGSMGGVSLPLRLASRLPLRAPPAVTGRARTMSGEFDVWGATLDGAIRISGVTLDDPELQFNERFAWGNVGSSALKRFVVTIDPTNQRIRLAEPEDQ